VWQVAGAAHGLTRGVNRGPVSADALLERDEQLAELRAGAADVAHRQRGRLISIIGQSGTGRSSLLQATAEIADELGLQVASAVATELESEFAFGVIRQLFEPSVLGATPERRKSLFSGAAGMAEAVFVDGGAAAERVDGLIHGLYWLAANCAWGAAAAGRAGLALLVDDLQCADPPSLRSLRYLARRLTAVPVLLVVSASASLPPATRELAGELLDDQVGETVRLGALSSAAVTKLVTLAFGGDADDDFSAACAAACGGNPFLLRELLAQLDARGIQPTTGNRGQVQALAPEPVRRAVRRRLSPLGPEAERFVRAASVLGDDCKPLAAATLCGLSPEAAMRSADLLQEAGILRSGDPVVFTQPVVRAAVESDMAPGQRGLAHAKAAALLYEHAAGPEQIATHLLRAPAGNSERSVETLRRAAARAMERGEPETATRYLVRALDEAPTEQRRAMLLVELGEVELASGSAHAVHRLHDALGYLTDPAERGPVWAKLGEALMSRGRHEDAARALARGIVELGDGEDRLSRELRARFATTTVLVPSLADQGAQSVQRVLRSSREDPVPAERMVLAQFAVQQAMSAAPAREVRELAERAWGEGALLEEEGPDAIAWSLVTGALTIAGFYSASVDVSTAVIGAAERRGDTPAAATAAFCRSGPTHRMGRLEEAIDDTERALAAREHGWEAYVGGVSAVLGLALTDRDELDRAEEVLALVDDERFAQSSERAPLLDARGWLRLAQQQPKAALGDFEEAGRLFDGIGMRVGFSFWRGGGALAALQMDDRQRGRELMAEDLRLARAMQAPALIGRSLRVLGVISGAAEGMTLMQQAADALQRSEARPEYLAALVDLGSAMRRSGRRAQARRPLHEAVALAEEMDARLLGRRAREELRATGGRMRPRSVGGLEALTAGERRVAELAAQGRTNREIAQELFVTQKAVEWHLANAYRKLAIRSRRELAEHLIGIESDEDLT
jgi:DNA-binding CsgD family transcriptional regulator